MAKILVVDDERGNRITLPRLLEAEGHQAEAADGVPAALKLLAQTEFDVVITDIIMPQITGIDLLGEIHAHYPGIKTIVITGEPTVDTAAESLRLNAFDYLAKPIDGDHLCQVVSHAVQIKRLEDENQQYHKNLERMVEERTQRIEQYNARLRHLAANANELAFCHDVEEFGTKALHLLSENIGAQGGSIYHRRVNNLEMLATLDPAHGQCRVSLPPPPHTVFDRLFQEKKAFIIENIHEDRQYQSSGWSGYTNGSLLVLPCQDKSGEIALVITLHNKQQPPFTPEDLDLGRILAAHSLEIVNNIIITTAKQQAEAERQKMEEQFRQAQKMESVGLLAGGIAHDFNNLLQAILGYTSMLRDMVPAQSKPGDYLEQIEAAGERAARLVSQLLAFSRQQVMRMDILDLNLQTAELIRMLGRLLGEHIAINFAPECQPALIKADRGMMDQMLINLCVNARDAMEQGGALTLRTCRAELDGSFCAPYCGATPGSYVCLTVADTGCGMDHETMTRIFEPFFTTKGPGKGTGLGLATVYGIVNQHGGIIQVESKPGLGTVFSIYLPALATAERPDMAVRPSEVAAVGDETILLVEDEAIVRELGQLMLSSAGYRVLVAADGAEAVTVFTRHCAEIGLVIMDVVMPRLNGLGAMKRIRELKPGIPVIFASGYNEINEYERIIDMKRARLIKKPFRSEALLREVRKALDMAGMEPEGQNGERKKQC